MRKWFRISKISVIFRIFERTVSNFVADFDSNTALKADFDFYTNSAPNLDSSPVSNFVAAFIR